MTYRGKRVFDLVVAIPSTIVVSPLLLLMAAAVAQQLGRPVFFRQVRPGLHGRPFMMYKFRTMRDAYDASGYPLPDEARLTSFGRFLRSTSLDELPELVNVLKGDMSLVGPRPLLMRYLSRYTADQYRRHDAPPGITGWAQVNGRNAILWEEKFALDLWYIDHQSWWLDLRIMVLTVKKAIGRESINAAGHVTMEEFWG